MTDNINILFLYKKKNCILTEIVNPFMFNNLFKFFV